MKKVKKITSFILILAVLSSVLVFFPSCSNAYGEEESISILTDLLYRDAELNKILWGEGLPIDGDPGEHIDDTTFYYMEVSVMSPYTGLDELKEAVKETYSEDLINIIWQNAFGVEGVESTIIPRYAENKNGFLQINVAEATVKKFDLIATAHLDTAKLVRAKKDRIKFDIQISTDGSESHREKRVEICLENGVWKLDTQTWIKEVDSGQ